MDGVHLSPDDLRVGHFLLRVHDDQPDPLQHHVEQVPDGVYGKRDNRRVATRFKPSV